METIAHTPGTPRCYERISLNITSSEVLATAEAFLGFISLPTAERAKITHFDPERPRVGRSGYMHKTAVDNKHVFHMTPDIKKNYIYSHGDFKQLPEETRNFLRSAEAMYSSVSEDAKSKYEELEDLMPGVVGMHFPRSGRLRHHLRFLAYEATDKNILAQGHYDKGSCTIAIAESYDGLRIGFGQQDLELLQRENYEPIFFYGYGWHQLSEMVDIVQPKRAAWHDVINTGGSVTDKIARWAIVYFLDPAKIYLDSTQEQTHTPIPWRGLGSFALRSDNKSFLVD